MTTLRQLKHYAGRGLGLVAKGLVATLVALVRTYQIALSPMHGPCCRFSPSCSAYAIEAMQRHGLHWGLWLTARRLLRCHPWGGFGFDPVPLIRPSLAQFFSRLLHGPHHSS